MPALAPQILALSTFVGGAVLLVSGAAPAVHERMVWLKALLPLGFIHAAHFLGSIAGVGLLILARGLQRRLDAACVATVALLTGGIVFSMFKGLDNEEALAMAMAFCSRPWSPCGGTSTGRHRFLASGCHRDGSWPSLQ